MKMTYSGVHAWIKRIAGQPNYCEICKTTKAKKFEWSNKSGKYIRNKNDWQRLCKKCHYEYDNQFEKWKLAVTTKHNWKVK